MAVGEDPRAVLHPAAAAALAAGGARFVAVAPAARTLPGGEDGPAWVADADGTLGRWFRHRRRAVAVIRPDRFVFGAFPAGGGAEIEAVLHPS